MGIREIKRYEVVWPQSPCTFEELEQAKRDIETVTNGTDGSETQVIIARACQFFKVDHKAMMRRDRSTEASFRRFMVYKLLRDRGVSFPAIGRAFAVHGDPDYPRDHGGVMYGVNRINSMMDTGQKFTRKSTDPKMKYEVESFRSQYSKLKREIEKALKP